MTAAWVARLVARAPADTTENTSLTWAVADDCTTTIAWLHNYWSDAYGIERLDVRATLLDASGAPVADWTFALAPDETLAIDVRERCRALDLGLPFEGQLLLRVAHDKLVAGRPVQVFGEYQRDDGESTGVHGQYGEMRLPAAQVVSAMRVAEGAGERTAMIVTNPYRGPGGPTPMRAELTVLSSAGRRLHARLAPLGPGATRRVYVDDVFPDLRRFLEGRPGHARLKLPCPSSRVATFVERADGGGFVVNHGTVDRVFDQGAGVLTSGGAVQPVASAFVLCDESRDTELTFPNVWGPIAADYEVAVDLYSPNGEPVARRLLVVPKDGLASLRLRAVLLEAGIGLPAVAHAEVRVRPSIALDEWPATFDLLVALINDEDRTGEVQVGSDFYNVAVPEGPKWPDIRRTRVFGRVRTGEGHRTKLFLSYPVAADDASAPTLPMLTLLSATGRDRLTREVELAPHGCLFADLEDLFPDASSILGERGAGTLRVRDTNARLYGYYLVETEGARTVPICHLIGG